jgi:hypothetical protein
MLFPTYTHSYRLTIAVDDNGVMREASSVISPSFQDHYWNPAAWTPRGLLKYRWKQTCTGAPPYLDFGDRGLLLIGMHNSYSSVQTLAMNVFIPKEDRGWLINLPYVDKIRNVPARAKRSVEISDWPQFIWLRDPKDPESAAFVSGQLLTTGAYNFKLLSVEIEMTTDAASRDIEPKLLAMLPWLSAMRERESSGTHFGTVASCEMRTACEQQARKLYAGDLLCAD